MSAKQEKKKRAVEKQVERNLEENLYLNKMAESYFEGASEKEEMMSLWYLDACLVKTLMPSISDEELMPDNLPMNMVKVGLISPEEFVSEFLDVEVQNSYI